MRSLLIFLACVVPFGAALWWSDPPSRTREALPQPPGGHDSAPVLSGDDLADDMGAPPFRAAIRRANDFELRIYEEDYVRAFVRLGRLVRRDGAPRLENVSGAVFDPPRDGRPRLRLTLEAPAVRADLRRFVNDPRGAARVAQLTGGVVVRDAAGNPLVRLDTLRFDIDAKRFTSPDPIVLQLAGKGAEVRGTGVEADLDLRRVRLLANVTAGIASEGRTLRVECRGAGQVEELDGGRRLRITLEGGARFAGDFGSATCDRVLVELDRRDEKYAIRRATLSGDVVIEIAPGIGQGLERLQAPEVVLEGETRVRCAGPVMAVRRGAFAAFGPGDRVVDIVAGGGVDLRLRRDEKGALSLEELRFPDGLAADDREGAGRFQARTVTYVVDTGTLDALDVREARAADGWFTAGHVHARLAGKRRVDLVVRGEKRFQFIADGKLGPLGKTERGTLDLTARGPLLATIDGDAIALELRDSVVARVGEAVGFDAGYMTLTLLKGAITSFEAKTTVHLFAPGQSVTADRLVHENGKTMIEGAPVDMVRDGNRLRAKHVAYSDDGTFRAGEDVDMRATLADGKTWRFKCAAIEGAFEAKQVRRVVATGPLTAAGPDGERAAGDRFGYDAATGLAVLTGKPARLERGATLVAPGFEVVIEDKQPARGATRGKSIIEMKAAPGSSIDRWILRLQGPARWSGDRIEVPAGAHLEGYGKDGKRALAAQAGAVTVHVEKSGKTWQPRKIEGRKGVRVVSAGKQPATVTARALDYVLADKKLEVAGAARVAAPGWPERVTFEKVVFRLTEKGIDLLRASQVDIGGSRRKPAGK